MLHQIKSCKKNWALQQWGKTTLTYGKRDARHANDEGRFLGGQITTSKIVY